MLTDAQIKTRKDRWQRNKRSERERKATPPPTVPSPDEVSLAATEATARVRAAVMPDGFIVEMARMLREQGVQHGPEDLFALWYDARNRADRPNRDIWRMSNGARDLTIEVWAVRTVLERQRGPGKATAGKIAKWLIDHGRGRDCTAGSLRVMVWRALNRIKRIEEAAT